MRVAAIDVGTNTILMVVVEAGGRRLADRARIVRLGRGVDRTKMLAPDAIARALETLREYAAEAKSLGATIAAVGTQALREAQNADDFLRPARDILGAPVEVIDGEREALLSWRAVRESLGLVDAIVMDVGGGSTEFVVARGGQVQSKVSVRIGSVRLHERCGDDVAAIEREITIPELPRGLPLVGIAGTVTTLAAMKLGLEPYDPDRVHGSRLSRAEVGAQIDRLRTEDRRTIRGLEPGRADVILAGALIVAQAMDAAGAAELIVSDRGVRWGLAYERLSC